MAHREATPLMKAFRKFLRGRDHTLSHKFADIIAARDQPPPTIPGGPYHKTSKIYYYTRDGRREVQPPLVITAGKEIAARNCVGAVGRGCYGY